MAEIAIRRESDSLLEPAAVITAILAASAAAWIVLVVRMSEMDGGPGGDPGALGWFTVSWAVMTAAMMLPAAAPAVLRAVRLAHSKTGAALPFLAGYGAVWMVAGLAGYAVVVAVRSAHPGAIGWSAEGRYLAGGAPQPPGFTSSAAPSATGLRAARRPGGSFGAAARRAPCSRASSTVAAAWPAAGI